MILPLICPVDLIAVRRNTVTSLNIDRAHYIIFTTLHCTIKWFWLYRVCGSYADLDGGFISEALMDFTGGVHMEFVLNEAPTYLWDIMDHAAKSQTLMGCATYHGVRPLIIMDSMIHRQILLAWTIDIEIQLKSKVYIHLAESAKCLLFYQNKRDHTKCMLLFI